MKKQIRHVSVFQSAKVMAVLFFVISIPFVLIMAIPTLLLHRSDTGPGLFMLILMPFLYLVVGFLFSALGAWVYNLVAARIGARLFEVLDRRAMLATGATVWSVVDKPAIEAQLDG